MFEAALANAKLVNKKPHVIPQSGAAEINLFCDEVMESWWFEEHDDNSYDDCYDDWYDDWYDDDDEWSSILLGLQEPV